MNLISHLFKKIKIAISLFLPVAFSCNSASSSEVVKTVGMPEPDKACIREICTVRKSDGARICYFKVDCIRREGWDTLPEIKFWCRIVTLNKDSVLANVIENRKGLAVFPKKLIDSLEQKGHLHLFRDELARQFNIDSTLRIRFTAGKNHFYRFDKIDMKMARAITLFDSFGVDPFYAQSVLLIESPGSNKQKSTAGAYGNFQLMPFVARKYGLRVDKYVDERENFDRSAYAAAMLIKEICIPYARKWCVVYGFEADESALWFKLLALHNYNAGAGTVRSAMAVLPKHVQGNDLIKTLWKTSAGYFRSEAQNYSQLALACYLEFEKQNMLHTEETRVVYPKN
jgi:soluble lytic murein transglycosylase-like protein